jgi:hypothetical protein
MVLVNVNEIEIYCDNGFDDYYANVLALPFTPIDNNPIRYGINPILIDRAVENYLTIRITRNRAERKFSFMFVFESSSFSSKKVYCFHPIIFLTPHSKQ